ncbi:MAG TPA: hypothetical protein VJX48_06705 [Xanthobacteraceae bacterium]|nr:hypothetical protein [Xanthobacteraceae bacterium]
MREDSDHFRNYVPLLRRIIIVVAVLAAIPVILWTITVFMRTYVGQPKIPTFRQLAATGTITVPRNASANLDTGGQPASDQSKPSDSSSATIGAGAATTDARDASAAPKGPLLGDRSPNGGANTPAAASKMANTSAVVPANPQPTEMLAAAAPPDGAAPNTGALVAQQPAASGSPPADVSPAADPLSGPIPLPPHRPRLVAMAQMTPTNVPMPRPRPDAAGPAASDGTTAGPFDWLQNMFHKSSE